MKIRGADRHEPLCKATVPQYTKDLFAREKPGWYLMGQAAITAQ
jgi:hypothetical protein